MLVVLVALAGLGLAAGCLTTLGPDIRATGEHQQLTRRDPDELCLGCHEPERSAQRRLAAMDPAARQQQLERMMRGGGSPLVAQWMIDDRRSCQTCHVLRGASR